MMKTQLTRIALALLLTASLAACGGEEEEATPDPEPAAEPAPEPEPEPAAPAYTAGQFVEVNWNDTWYVSRINTVNDDGTYNIHYAGWGDDQDADVGADLIRTLENGEEAFNAQENPGTEITADTELAEGTAVHARWGGRWYDATVTGVENGQAHITYPGHDESWDQDVDPTSLRLRSTD